MDHALSWREARQDDVPGWVALVESAYRGDASRAGWTTEADLLDGQRLDVEMGGSVLAAENAVVLLFWLQEGLVEDPVACVELEDRGDGVVYLGTFAVDPQRQGSGLGKAVVAVAEQTAVDRWAATRIRMTVIQQRDELIRFYERRGYGLTGEREPFPYGQEEFGAPRRNDLEFVVLEKSLT